MSIMIYTRDLMKGYFDDGYSITLTEAPNDIGESLRRGTVLTTRELPKTSLKKLDFTEYPELRISCGLIAWLQITLITSRALPEYPLSQDLHFAECYQLIPAQIFMCPLTQFPLLYASQALHCMTCLVASAASNS